MKNRGAICAVSFVLINLLIYRGAEWLVWIFFLPLIILALSSPLLEVITFGSIAVFLTGYLWLWWLNLYDIQVFAIALLIFYLFFLSLLILIRLLCSGHPPVKWDSASASNGKRDRRDGIKTALLILVPPTAWFSLQEILSCTPIGGSWIDLAMFHPTMAPLIWIVGARGITFTMVLINSLIASLLLRPSRRIALITLTIILVVAGCIAYSNLWRMEEDSITVSLLQGNFPEEWEWRRENAGTVILKTYLTMTKAVAEQEPAIIAWPEYAIPRDIFVNKRLFNRIAAVSERISSSIILGSITEIGGLAGGETRFLNTAALVSPQPDTIPHGQYLSVHPVPFDEWTLPGNEIHTITTEKATLGILLCFEEIIPEIPAELSRKGAELLISLANNSSFDGSRGIHLTELQSRLRAAENGKYLARVTNTGITQVVNPCGRIEAVVKPLSRQILTSEVQLINRVTPYSRYGDKLTGLIILIAWGIVLIAACRRQKKHSPQRRKEREENILIV